MRTELKEYIIHVANELGYVHKMERYSMFVLAYYDKDLEMIRPFANRLTDGLQPPEAEVYIMDIINVVVDNPLFYEYILASEQPVTLEDFIMALKQYNCASRIIEEMDKPFVQKEIVKQTSHIECVAASIDIIFQALGEAGDDLATTLFRNIVEGDYRKQISSPVNYPKYSDIANHPYYRKDIIKRLNEYEEIDDQLTLF